MCEVGHTPPGVLSRRGQAAARHPARRARPVRVALPSRCRGDGRRRPRGRAAGPQTGGDGGRRGRACGHGAAAVRVPRGREARQRAGRVRDRPERPPGARRGRLHRRLQRLPAPARRRVGYRARRGLRRAPLAAAKRRACDGHRAPQRPLARAGRAALRAGPDRGRRVVHLAHQGAPRGGVGRRAALRPARDGQAPV